MQLAEFQLKRKAHAGRKKPYVKKKIPKALRETLWVQANGKNFEAKCATTWCLNQITAYDFQAGHKVPESKGGPTTLKNLVPICSRCNLSMADTYTFDEWCRLQGRSGGGGPKALSPPSQPSWFAWLWSCFRPSFTSVVLPVAPVGPSDKKKI